MNNLVNEHLGWPERNGIPTLPIHTEVREVVWKVIPGMKHIDSVSLWLQPADAVTADGLVAVFRTDVFGPAFVADAIRGIVENWTLHEEHAALDQREMP